MLPKATASQKKITRAFLRELVEQLITPGIVIYSIVIDNLSAQAPGLDLCPS
jgi:hypothetical protein